MAKLAKAVIQAMAVVDAFLYNNDVAPIVQLQQGAPVTNSVAMAREFGCRHDSVLRSLDALIADSTIPLLAFKKKDCIDVHGKKQRMIELTEPGALIAMPFIGGPTARIGQIKMVSAFLSMRVELAAQQGKRLQASMIAHPNDKKGASRSRPPLAAIA